MTMPTAVNAHGCVELTTCQATKAFVSRVLQRGTVRGAVAATEVDWRPTTPTPPAPQPPVSSSRGRLSLCTIYQGQCLSPTLPLNLAQHLLWLRGRPKEAERGCLHSHRDLPASPGRCPISVLCAHTCQEAKQKGTAGAAGTPLLGSRLSGP